MKGGGTYRRFEKSSQVRHAHFQKKNHRWNSRESHSRRLERGVDFQYFEGASCGRYYQAQRSYSETVLHPRSQSSSFRQNWCWVFQDGTRGLEKSAAGRTRETRLERGLRDTVRVPIRSEIGVGGTEGVGAGATP
jgi:hypothetical protein